MEEPLEWNAASDADTGLLVGLLDLDAGDRLEEEEVGFVVHEHHDVIVGLPELRGHRVLGRRSRGLLFFIRQDASQSPVEAGIVELLQEVLQHLPVFVGELGDVIVREKVRDLIGLGGKILDVTRDLRETELQGGLTPCMACHDESRQ